MKVVIRNSNPFDIKVLVRTGVGSGAELGADSGFEDVVLKTGEETEVDASSIASIRSLEVGSNNVGLDLSYVAG